MWFSLSAVDYSFPIYAVQVLSIVSNISNGCWGDIIFGRVKFIVQKQAINDFRIRLIFIQDIAWPAVEITYKKQLLYGSILNLSRYCYRKGALFQQIIQQSPVKNRKKKRKVWPEQMGPNIDSRFFYYLRLFISVHVLLCKWEMTLHLKMNLAF